MTGNTQGDGSHPDGMPPALSRHGFAVLLVALGLLLTSTPAIFALRSHPRLSSVLFSSGFAGMLVVAVVKLARKTWTRVVCISLVVATLSAQGFYLSLGHGWLQVVSHILAICLLGYTTGAVLTALFKRMRVNSDTICAALCVYLLLGVMWAVVYSLLEVLAPGSFAGAVAGDTSTTFMRFGTSDSIYPLYYSFITLTTLGYGDISPLSSSARMLSAAEATVGQIYLAVLVARLVGLHISHGVGRQT